MTTPPGAWKRGIHVRLNSLLMTLGLSSALAFAGPDDHPEPREKSEPGLLLAFHQITPGVGLRDTNSRSGFGAMVAIGGETGRFVVEGSTFPVQSRSIDGNSRRIHVVTWSLGGDLKLPLIHGPQTSIYALGGLRLDYWVSGEGGESHPDNSAGNLGFRLGLGLRLGRIFSEARYRFALGDVRVHSANSGPDNGWSAYELGIGVLF